MKTFTTSNANLINILTNSDSEVFVKKTRYSVIINILDLPVAAACRLINYRLRDGLTFREDPCGWVNIFDGGSLIGTIE
jgi:hypothetical protein